LPGHRLFAKRRVCTQFVPSLPDKLLDLYTKQLVASSPSAGGILELYILLPRPGLLHSIVRGRASKDGVAGKASIQLELVRLQGIHFLVPLF